jgi:hypothetical protein
LVTINKFLEYKFNNETNKIEKIVIESGDRTINAMKMKYNSTNNRMIINVNEISERIIKSNGQETILERLYYPVKSQVITQSEFQIP